jgi:putative hydrolase of the HAD superfamily
MEKFFVNQLPDLPFENIIFDLGGVIMHLDLDKTTEAFRRLGLHELSLTTDTVTVQKIYKDYEKGSISSAEFRKGIKASYASPISDEEFDEAWSAMLVEIPEDRIDFLANLGSRYRTFLLSNTNEIHLNHLNQYLNESFGIEDFSALFEADYYSHQLKMRKPDMEIFSTVCEQSDIEPSLTVFIDDVEANVRAACAAGMIGIHLVAPATIEEVLDSLITEN